LVPVRVEWFRQRFPGFVSDVHDSGGSGAHLADGVLAKGGDKQAAGGVSRPGSGISPVHSGGAVFRQMRDHASGIAVWVFYHDHRIAVVMPVAVVDDVWAGLLD
jgi:hypothetical protein